MAGDWIDEQERRDHCFPMIARPVAISATKVMTSFAAWPYSQLRLSSSQLGVTEVQFAVA